MAKTTPAVRIGRRDQGGSAKPGASSVAPLRQAGTARPRPKGTALPDPRVARASSSTPRPGAAANRTAHNAGKAGATSSGRIKVQAVAVGYYGLERKRPGDVFYIANEQEFSSRWMERVDRSTPLSTTTPNQAIRKETDQIAQGKRAEAAARSGQGAPATARTFDRDALEGDEGDEDNE